jgi:mannose-6-phosphate isomerase-like protein (cupin superfamily)
MELIQGAGRYTSPGDEPNHYVEHVRVPDMSVGTYSIPAGGVDDQTPHSEDEIYVVMSGRATLVGAEDAIDVGPGDVLFVAAGEDHTFVDVSDDLALLVVFAPPYESRRGASA